MALALEQVGAVDPGGDHPDQRLAGPRHGHRPIGQNEPVGPAGLGDGDSLHARQRATRTRSTGDAASCVAYASTGASGPLPGVVKPPELTSRRAGSAAYDLVTTTRMTATPGEVA
ncbi:hypothetical protein GCM10022204_24020 [Microlunatus aurantiacus]|uniref:Uncharacterized protein n=1 Tax=Microlunatus aurantiacus TaxID=446786 RepID=A0ABP7DJT3_9ACTN